MTSSLPHEVRDVFERFVTTEYTTVGARRQPITWPVTPYYRQGGACIDVTTGLGYPKKADDAKRHPSVSLLFSDPTGSGIETGIQVLVQGTADVDERDLAANRERYFREALVKLPATRRMHPPAPVRALFDWYYTRIYVYVRPERVFVWPDCDFSKDPALYGTHVEEARTHHSAEPEAPPPAPAGGGPTWDSRMDQLGERLAGVGLAESQPLDQLERVVRAQAPADLAGRAAPSPGWLRGFAHGPHDTGSRRGAPRSDSGRAWRRLGGRGNGCRGAGSGSSGSPGRGR